MLGAIKSCLCEDSSARPTAPHLRRLTQKVVGANRSIVEEMLHKQEEHATSLQQIVAERTKDLVAERSKIDDLLSEMLPK